MLLKFQLESQLVQFIPFLHAQDLPSSFSTQKDKGRSNGLIHQKAMDNFLGQIIISFTKRNSLFDLIYKHLFKYTYVRSLHSRIYLFSGFVQCQTKEPKLEILPIQSLQRKPVGKSLMLTCRPDVDNTNLVTDLQWQDNTNMVVQPKP